MFVYTINISMKIFIYFHNLVITVPPLVSNLRPLKIIEGMDLSVICNATPGNPNSTTFFWTRVNKLEFRQNGTTLVLNSIQRNSSGIYNCTAENTYYGERKGNHSQSMEVDVLCKFMYNF